MAFALVVLAVGSVVAGYAGIGGWFERFLEPSFGIMAQAADSGTENTLMLVSTIVALSGIGLATFFFLKSRETARAVAEQFSGVYRVLSRKYYVDEIYDAGLVQPIRIISKDALWRGLDVRVIDGAVNGVAEVVGAMGEWLRRAQTGSVRTYAASLFLGVVTVLGYYLWR
jgi:NADH-quinone oxidoreductase subunit L